MSSVYYSLYDDKLVVNRIRQKLPHLFQLAELESQRSGKIGMEVGSIRERILVALLMYKYGLDDVDPDVPITEPETDVYVKGEPLSIKTVTSSGNYFNGVKVSWSVDEETVRQFERRYSPSCDMLLARIKWGGMGQLFLFPKEAQLSVLLNMGSDKYLKLPKPGANSRGVEISKEALGLLVEHELTRKINIRFVREELDYREVYVRWLDAWHGL